MWNDVRDFAGKLLGYDKEILYLKNEIARMQTNIENLTLSDIIKLNALAYKVQQLNDLVYQLRKTDEGKADKIIELQGDLEQKINECNDSLSAIASLKVELALYGEIDCATPEWLDQTKKPYTPSKQFFKPDGTMGAYFIDYPQDMYSIADYMRRIIKSNGWNKLPTKFERCMAAWTWSCDKNVRTYEYDFLDSWQLPVESYYRKRTDCEDSTIQLVTMLRALGFSPAEDFNAVGPTSFGYHSYPIIEFTEEEAKGNDKLDGAGWYIFESTINGTPIKPKKLIGSGYMIDTGGVQNWKFAGQIRPLFSSDFNSTVTGASPIARRVDNGKDKQERIQKYWEDEGLCTKP